MKTELKRIKTMAIDICSNLNEIPSCDVSIENNEYIVNAYNIASGLKSFIDDLMERENGNT